MNDNCKKTGSGAKLVTRCTENSRVESFYAGKTVFLTGSTGFMGKCLLEKMLRGCPDIERIYVLVRAKRGSTTQERMKKYFDDTLFETVRKMYPGCESKVHVIEGDLMTEDLSISESDRKKLIEEVDYIFHNASNVKFNEKISIALSINVLGTLGMINLAKKCKKVQAFMYVSTGYSHCYNKHIEEVNYPAPADEKLVREMIRTDKALGGGYPENKLKEILGKFPNTYCFSKATAEGLIHEMGKEVAFPCIIYRPTIVLSSWKEPVSGWVDNLNGPGLLFVGYALGIVRAVYLRDYVMDFIPVDMAINAILVSMWDATKNRARISGAFVYNYGSSTTKPVTIRDIKRNCIPNNGTLPTPSIHTIWPPGIVMTECVYYFAILHVLFHLIPAILIDGYLLLNGKKTQALSAYKKATMNYSHLLHFMHGNWRIDITEMTKAIDRMEPIDHELFNCDVRRLDWADYCSTYWNGLRRYPLKDPPSTVPAALKKFRKLQIINDIVVYIFLFSLTYFILHYLGIL